MNIKFGTDGIRGVANEALSPEIAFRIGLAAGTLIKQKDALPRVVMGRDTRKSGSMLGAALAAGFCSAGVNVVAMGHVPTGGISFVTRTGDFSMGVVISASHNPAPDNGIKLIASDGKKISDADEATIVALVARDDIVRPTGGAVGSIDSSRADVDRYLSFLETLVPERLDGMKVAVDCANGAAYGLGPEILRRLGADLIIVGDSPNGMNINSDGGATKPETIQTLTRESGAVIGIAFDGDADRAVFSDSKARLINGDRTMAIWASHWRNTDRFTPSTIVGTVMSNGGFAAYAATNGITLARADVGDKYVSRMMDELGAKIGGEQSGHIIFSERGPTGDGLITALELLRVLKLSGRDASSFYDEFENFPQLLVNVTVGDKTGWDTRQAIVSAIAEAQNLLAPAGRLNVRASGTQPMIRVMGESPDMAQTQTAVDLVANALISELGGSIYSRVDLTHALGD
jgi:phosphoglucosamine mutase